MTGGHRKQLTILFADVCRSTELFELLGDVVARRIIGAALDQMATLVAAANGQVIKSLGDELLCTFASPTGAAEAASQMQQRVPHELPQEQGQLALRIGFHHGDVLQEDADVFGDAVNVAARLAGNAKAGQILVSSQSAVDLTSFITRDLGEITLKGRKQPVAVSEMLWQDDLGALTTVAGPLSEAQINAAMKLVLRFGSREWEMNSRSFPTTIGRDEHNDLIVDQPLVSRHHATIEARPESFVVIDRSTNGTLVVMNGQRFDLHHTELRLHHRGEICPGKSDLDPIFFELRRAD